MYGGLASIDVPALVRIKPGALDRLGVYCTRAGWSHVVLVRSAGLPESLLDRARRALVDVEVVLDAIEDEPSLAAAARLLAALPGRARALIALGGGRAVDLAKHAASIAGLPFVAVPTSLSHDGFASPLASLHTPNGRRSIACRPPCAVVVDTAVCLAAPAPLWLSGVGDVVAKVSAVFDWKLAFHARGEPVNDLAALLSDATVSQLSARPVRDLEGTRALATALLLNGVAMSLAGTSRPASGSEHLISHALDQLSARPRLHGLQVGVATYIVSQLQAALPGAGQGHERVARLLDASGFFDAIAADPFSRAEWQRALELAPSIKQDFYTVLSTRDVRAEFARLLAEDGPLARCFVD
ncbi:MAG TPA: iron-containing alcohol dehydrogenase family protein [Polyangiaceae bacterium]|nr:iron-containing alcohol dehydrogenase family protein [Polyangiaceae bacterium]